MESPSGESYNGLHDLTNTQPPSPSIRSISAALAASILCSPDLKDPLPDHVSIISLHNTTIPDDVDPASIPLPSSPRPRQLQHTVSGFSLRVRELHDVGDATSLKVAEPPRASTPTTMVDQMLSVFMAACSLKDDKKPRPKKKGGLEGADGPATSILKDNREPKNKKRPQDIADGVAPLRMSKTYRLASPWKKQKDAGKYQTPSPVQNKDLLAFFHEVVEKDHPEERNMSELPDMVQITLKIASGTKVCWASLNTVDTWAKLMGFVRYSSFPEMVVSQLRNITIEDSFENTITEEYWPPSKIKSGHKLNRIHLHISFDQPSSNPGRFLSALMGKKRKASSTIPGALVDKKIRKPNAFCVHGNAVSGVVIFVPEGLRLHITIKLLDGGLEFSHGSCTIQRSPFLDADPHGVYWSLETSDGWEFSVKEPDEVILSLNMCDTAAPQSYEVQYGLKQFTWESFGSMIVPVDKLRGVVQGLMRGLGYPESKINEYISFWQSRVEATNPTHIEIQALTHPTLTHPTSIILENTSSYALTDPTHYSVEVTRLLLSFRPFTSNLLEEIETTGLCLAIMTRIREQAGHRFEMPHSGSTTSSDWKTIRIFEAGGMVAYESCRPALSRKRVGDKPENSYWI